MQVPVNNQSWKRLEFQQMSKQEENTSDEVCHCVICGKLQVACYGGAEDPHAPWKEKLEKQQMKRYGKTFLQQ